MLAWAPYLAPFMPPGFYSLTLLCRSGPPDAGDEESDDFVDELLMGLATGESRLAYFK